MLQKLCRLAVAVFTCAVAHPLTAAEGASRPVFEASGDVQVPAFVLPPSSLMSEEGREFQKLRARIPAGGMRREPDIAKSRAGLSVRLAPQVVAEGMGHCYLYSPQLPEARDAHELTVRFFRVQLR